MKVLELLIQTRILFGWR